MLYVYITVFHLFVKMYFLTLHNGIVSKCLVFVTEDGSNIDILHYKLDVSDFKCED